MPRDDHKSGKDRDLAKRARLAQARGEPPAANAEETYEAAHRENLQRQLRSFEKTDAAGEIIYVKKAGVSELQRVLLTFSPDDQKALQEEQSEIEDGRTMVARMRQTALERGGNLLRRAWPLFDLLSMLPDTSKAEAVRDIAKDPVDRRGKHIITLTAAEYASLASGLKQGKGKA
jgi:hypothetical protein